MRNRVILAVLVCTFLAALSPLAAAPVVIERGVDVFTTVANGKTFYDFAKNPIPAGFFCKGSPAFSGRVALRGVPLETAKAGDLRGADTVIERLDDAVFDASGTAVTRIRFRALSLASIAPIKTGCGAYHVYVSLAGNQRETSMRIARTSERGGTFAAPLAVDARMSFVPVKNRASRKLELTGSFTFPATVKPWSVEGRPEAKRIGRVMVDTNGDLKPDTFIAGTSNFAPGWSPDAERTINKARGSCSICEPESCHTDPGTGEEHCTGPVQVCYPYNCN